MGNHQNLKRRWFYRTKTNLPILPHDKFDAGGVIFYILCDALFFQEAFGICRA